MSDVDPFRYLPLASSRAVIAPDGSVVHELLRGTNRPGGSTAHCSLAPGGISRPIRHRTVDEVWFVLGGRAEFWRAVADQEDLREVGPEDSLRIIAGTVFQFRTLGPEPFRALLFTVPEWPGNDEAVPVDVGRWPWV